MKQAVEYDCQIVIRFAQRRMTMALVQISQAQGRVPVTIFQLQDRVNLGNYQELEQTAKDAYDNGMRDLVIDLSQTPSLTSIGIRALVVIHKMLATDGANHLKLAGLTAPIREMLQIAGITGFIEMYASVDEAVASF
jgi:anti-anti-sigma factor